VVAFNRAASLLPAEPAGAGLEPPAVGVGALLAVVIVVGGAVPAATRPTEVHLPSGPYVVGPVAVDVDPHQTAHCRCLTLSPSTGSGTPPRIGSSVSSRYQPSRPMGW